MQRLKSRCLINCMNITDIEGKSIEVTDLDKAIRQAAMFTNMKHIEKAFEQTDKYLKAYWTDVLKKLKQLKKL